MPTGLQQSKRLKISMNHFKSLLAVSALGVAVFGAASTAQASGGASATVSFAQVGADVVATLSGNFDLTGTSPVGPIPNSKGVGSGSIAFGDGQVTLAPFFSNGFVFDGSSTGPDSFAGTSISADSHSGDLLYIQPAVNGFGFQAGYSGGSLSATMTFLGRTLGNFGFTSGQTSRWTYGAGGVNEFIIVATSGGSTGGGTTGGGGAVPEPGEWAAMGILGAGLTGLVLRKRRKA